MLRGTTERRMKSFQQIRQRQNKTCLSFTLFEVIVYKYFCNLSLLVKCLFKGRTSPLPHKANLYLQRTTFIYSFMKLNIYIHNTILVFLFTLNYIKLKKFRKVQDMPDCQTGPLAENLKICFTKQAHRGSLLEGLCLLHSAVLQAYIFNIK